MLLQIELNSKKTSDCYLEDNKIIPCGYHKDRVFNTPYEITADIIQKIHFNNGQIEPSVKSRELAEKFHPDNNPPAGGWFLVKEQRLWLQDTLRDIFINKFSDGDSVVILEAGVASFIHHYTYTIILKRVLESLPFKMNIDLVVTDKCSFPLLCIDIIRKNWETVKKDRKIDIQGFELSIQDVFIDLIEKEGIINYEGIKTTTLQGDLTNHEIFFSVREKYDIVTEHFVTAVIENYEFIEKIRDTYNAIIQDGGFLLCACGINRSQGRIGFNKFIELHENDNNFLLQKEELSWDPYGMKRSDILKLLEDKPANAAFGNTLFKFLKVK